MDQYPNSNREEKDKHLWEIAKKRASFKYHLGTYLVVNAMFWVLWLLTGREQHNHGLPWPVWPLFGWGIGLAFHYIGAYVFPKENGVEKEYEKLKRERNNQTN